MNFIYNLFKYNYKHVLKEKLNSKHIVIRCPYCGDSVKDKTHAHCYIHLEQNVFYCVRCSTGGSLSRLLYKIRNRFNIDITKVIAKLQTTNQNATKQQINSLSALKQLYIQKEAKLIKQWLWSNNLLVDSTEIYPLNTYNAIKKYVKEDNLQNGIVYITLGNKLLYRPFEQNKKMRFRTLHLKDEYKQNNIETRLSIFSTYNEFKLKKYNYSSDKLIAIISESLTDLIAFHLNTQLNAIYISTNGKYTDDLKYILPLFDEIHYLVDSDATRQEIMFILKYFTNKPIHIHIPEDSIDYRSASSINTITITTT